MVLPSNLQLFAENQLICHQNFTVLPRWVKPAPKAAPPSVVLQQQTDMQSGACKIIGKAGYKTDSADGRQ